jgi:serine O-acetyltransferase
MTVDEYFNFIKFDLYRYSGNFNLKNFLYNYVFSPGFKYSFWMRSCNFLKSHSFFRFVLFPIARLILNYYEYKFGISISYRTKIGTGLYIGHFRGIVINQKAIIGKNCNISHQVTLGITNRGPKRGVPTIGDNVYIGPGAKIIGKINIGNNVAIGANCVAARDIPDNAVVVGVPGKVKSWEGSAGYINNINYE